MKTTKSNPRDFKRNGVQYAYILDSINWDYFEQQPANDAEAVASFFEIYGREYDCAYNRRMYPNEQNRLANYLQGLPGCISVDFTNHAISERLASWGINPTARNIQNWFNVCAARLLQLREILCK